MRRFIVLGWVWIAVSGFSFGVAWGAKPAQKPAEQQPAAPAPKVSPLQEALKQASRDGRPVLALGARPACPLCKSFLGRLGKDASLQPLLPNYAFVLMNVDAPTEHQELAKLRAMEGLLPFMYVVRADGQVLSATANASAEPTVAALLRDGIAKSGKFLRPADVPKYEAVYAKAQAALEREDTLQALTLLGGIERVHSTSSALYAAWLN